MWEPPARAVPREEKTSPESLSWSLLAPMYKSSEGGLSPGLFSSRKFLSSIDDPVIIGLINFGLFLAKRAALTESFRTEGYIDPQEIHIPGVDTDQCRQRNRLNPTPSITLVECWGLWHLALQRIVPRKLFCSNWSKWSKWSKWIVLSTLAFPLQPHGQKLNCGSSSAQPSLGPRVSHPAFDA